jgi:hypothetical protein
MAESLEDFLKTKESGNFVEASGNMKCVECEESVNNGKIDESEMILIYHCSKGHESRIKI